MVRRILTIALLLLPLSAPAHPEIEPPTFPDGHTVRFQSSAATGPVVGYQACIHRPGQDEVICGDTHNGAVWDLWVRAFDTEGAYGLQSEPARIIFIPEPGMLLMLGAGVLGLVVLRRTRR